MYTLINRIYKSYKFNISLSDGTKLNDFKYSGRPGDLNSKDDYYLLSNGLGVLETSLEVKNLSIYQNLKYDTIPKWVRINIANKLSSNIKEWVDLFFKYNSGTHNNQWLVVDFNKFESYLELGKPENFTEIIYLIEQTPILDQIAFEDVTNKLLSESYVASYNAPYFKDVINVLGYDKDNIYDTAYRYFVFKNISFNVYNIEDSKSVLRYHDEKEICNTICPRCDIVSDRPFGGVDSKITDRFMMKDDMKSIIIYGPSHIPGVSEPFDFRKFPSYSRLGIPDIFNFTWIEA